MNTLYLAGRSASIATGRLFAVDLVLEHASLCVGDGWSYWLTAPSIRGPGA
jgi:hypothetical protein